MPRLEASTQTPQAIDVPSTLEGVDKVTDPGIVLEKGIVSMVADSREAIELH